MNEDKELDQHRSAYGEAVAEAKIKILSKLAGHGGWSIAGDFLKGVADDDASVRDASFKLLRTWHDHVAEIPSSLLQPDKAYVMHVYYRSTFREERLPKDVQDILREIPFLFGENG